jgi:DNA-binding HxlR family transcriptional regulator
MSSSLPLEELIVLSRNRWAVALMADLAGHKGARFVELIHRLGLPRDSLVRTLEALKAAGWVIPNPGHGHPLRPEYILSEDGARVAFRAVAIAGTLTGLGIAPGQMTRWGLPLVRAIELGHARFNALSRILTDASPRALSQGLTSLADQSLITRQLVDARPPVSLYGLTKNGALLAQAA